MNVTHVFEGRKYPYHGILVKKRTETQYKNVITNLNYQDGYPKSVIGLWHIRWNELNRNISCAEQKKSWKKN